VLARHFVQNWQTISGGSGILWWNGAHAGHWDCFQDDSIAIILTKTWLAKYILHENLKDV
jgi:hypothetical protein